MTAAACTHRFVRLSVGLLLLLLGGGCAAFAVPEEPPRTTPSAPVWSDAELTEHLRFFNGREQEGRATGSRGFARSAAYVAARLHDYRLQPAFDGEYRSLYTTTVNVPQAASMQLDVDTMRFYPGLDFWPEGRSDSGRVRIERLAVGVPQGRLLPSTGVLLPAEQATTEVLRRLAGAGAGAVLVVGPLTPRPAPHAVDGLPIVQVTLRVAAQLLGRAPTAVQALLKAETPQRFALTHPLRLQVAVHRNTVGGAMNTLGYVTGKHPVQYRDLVIVCADLDGVGEIAGVRSYDLRHFGVGTAALLEVARNASYVSRHWPLPEATTLFAVWSGGRLGQAGLRAYLTQPTWPMRRVRAVIYLGLDPAERPAVEALLAPYGVPLYAVHADEALAPQDVVMVPEGATRRTVRERGTTLDAGALYARATVQSRALAAEAYRLLLRETTGTLLDHPLRPDTLTLPPATAPAAAGRR